MKRILMTCALAMAALHCGGGDGAQSQVNPDAPPAAGDAGASQVEASCDLKSQTDDPDDNGIDANCDGADGVIGVDVYVSGTTGADTNAGTPTDPLRTIPAALTLAKTRSGHVLLAAGQYAVDALKVPGTWSLIGGYAASFTGAPRRSATVLTGGPTGILIDGAGSVSLAHLTIRGASATDAAQRASHGLRVRAASTLLDDVSVEAGDGRDGASGRSGLAGALTCDGTRPSGANGSNGDVARKTPATAGADGNDGTSGADASGVLAVRDNLVTVPGVGLPGLGDGATGAKGGDGGSGYVTPVSPSTVYYTSGGRGAAGGCPGSGGAGAESGGPSVAILLISGQLELRRSNIVTGLGGAGGDGGEGGAGAPGASGERPTMTPPSAVPDSCLQPTDDPLGINCAEYGARGGTGGRGGHGGGGAGGATVGVLVSAGAKATVDDATTFDAGRAGGGGVGHGGGRAPSGTSARVLPL